MPNYNTIARDRSGRLIRSTHSATSPIDLRSQLFSMGYQLVGYEASTAEWSWDWFSCLHPANWLPTSSRDLELAFHQLAVMLRSGLKLLDALKALQLQTNRRSLSRMLESIYQSVRSGESLGNSISKYRIFSPVIQQLIEIGERTGTLDQSLQQCQEHLARRRVALSELRLALSYPAVVTFAALSIAAYLVLFVIPQLQIFLSTLGRKLPSMTQSLVDLSAWLKLSGSWIFMSFTLILGAFAVILAIPRSRLLIDKMLLRLPVLGGILRLAATAGLASSLSIMLQSGIRLVEALTICIPLQRNKFHARQVSVACQGIKRGQALAPLLTSQDGFSPILSSMIEVAERTGSMNRTLDDVAKLCETELQARIKRFSRMIEPMVILFAGGIVGYVYTAFFVALMSAGSNIR